MKLRFCSMLALTAILAASSFMADCGKKSSNDSDNMASNQNGTPSSNSSGASGGASNATSGGAPTSSSNGLPDANANGAAPATPSAPATIDVTLPAGTHLSVIIDQTISSATNSPGDLFHASLAKAVVVGGRTIFPRKSSVHGTVVNAVASGRLQTPAELSVRLSSIEANGSTYKFSTKAISSKGDSHKKRNVGFIGGGGAGGALIGGLAGGGKGALIGGLIGAGAGTAGAAATGKKDISIAAETRMLFVTSAPITVTVDNTPPAPAATPAAATAPATAGAPGSTPQ